MPVDLPPLLASARLYASGLGIVLYSRDVRQALIAAEAQAEQAVLYDRALSEGRAVRIATGSPQLYYECLFSSEPLLGSAAIIAQTTFGLRIERSILGLCDGYAELNWADDDYQHESIPIASGLFRADAYYLKGSRHPGDDMLLFFQLTPVPTLSELPRGSVELFFKP
jgi:hypothetical protein